MCVWYKVSHTKLRVTGSNHYGIAGWYTRTALQHALLVGFNCVTALCPRAFVCHIIMARSSTGNVLHEHVTSDGAHQSQGGEWTQLAVSSNPTFLYSIWSRREDLPPAFYVLKAETEKQRSTANTKNRIHCLLNDSPTLDTSGRPTKLAKYGSTRIASLS
jgi:hypothetical protein